MLDHAGPDPGVPWFWSDQFDLTVQVAWLPSLATEHAVRRRGDGVDMWFGLDETGRLVAVAGVGPGNSVARDVKLAERLIRAGAAPGHDQLRDPAVELRRLWQTHSAER